MITINEVRKKIQNEKDKKAHRRAFVNLTIQNFVDQEIEELREELIKEIECVKWKILEEKDII